MLSKQNVHVPLISGKCLLFLLKIGDTYTLVQSGGKVAEFSDCAKKTLRTRANSDDGSCKKRAGTLSGPDQQL